MRKDSLSIFPFCKRLLWSATLSVAAAAQADFYVGGGASYVELDSQRSSRDFVFTGVEPGPSNIRFSQDDHDFGWQFYGGYQWTKYLAVEIAYLDLGEISSTLQFDTPIYVEEPTTIVGDSSPFFTAVATQDMDVDTTGFTLSALVAYPNSSAFVPFVKAGVFQWQEEYHNSDSLDISLPSLFGPAQSWSDSEDGRSLALGLGVDYRLTDLLSLRGEYDYLRDVNDRNIDVFGLGVRFTLVR